MRCVHPLAQISNLNRSDKRGRAKMPSMRYRYTCWSLVAACSLSILPGRGYAQSDRDLGVDVESHGSAPPIPDWFSCVSEVEKKTYDEVKARACLQSILSHPEAVKGKVSLRRYKVRDVLTFRVEWPSLTVTDVDLGIDPGDLAKVHELLAINGQGLHPGSTYEFNGEASSTLVLDLLLRSEGRRAGISRTVSLDYKQKTAQVKFKIWEGPPGNTDPLVPPYVEACKIMNGNFNWSDADDLSPVSFVERRMKTKWCGCFSETDVQDDLAMLKEMKFLSEPNISVEGTGGQRSVSVKLRSHPIPIADIKVRGYGLLEGQIESAVPPLGIHAADTYSRSASRNVAQLLKKTFMKEGRQVRVFTDVEVTNEGTANLEFSVLAFPDDLVYVNGVKFNGSFPDKANVPD
jgi:hypothetical protein